MDAYVDTWWLVTTDLGNTYCRVVDWHTAYGRIDWKVELIGDSAPSPWITSGRFISQGSPDFTQAQAKTKELAKQKRKRKTSTEHLHRTEGHEEVRNANDPYSRLLAEEQTNDGNTEEGTPQSKRRRRRTVQ